MWVVTKPSPALHELERKGIDERHNSKIWDGASGSSEGVAIGFDSCTFPPFSFPESYPFPHWRHLDVDELEGVSASRRVGRTTCGKRMITG
ncbi:hypothetical protein E2562_009380 [Oryza meyeriana var. granulata]|uniref:Uncharacterized protein n=1 Tax=Oryza meyeriana var. granulata TaxID=110450 RepID=A0A6G1CDS8_9ORYZ|nr:hypothetical protein E2562_009380 [Oryza meyeriana var. granulata]